MILLVLPVSGAQAAPRRVVVVADTHRYRLLLRLARNHLDHRNPGKEAESPDTRHRRTAARGVKPRQVVARMGYLAGKFGTASQLEPQATLMLALAAGAAAIFLVAWMMRALHRLRADNAQLSHSVV